MLLNLHCGQFTLYPSVSDVRKILQRPEAVKFINQMLRHNEKFGEKILIIYPENL